jgi:hypothetical protein
MFQQFIAIISGPYYLRSYSSHICVVDVYGLQFVQSGQLSRDATKSVLRPLDDGNELLKHVSVKFGMHQ